MSKVMVVTSGKGGVGKTTSSAALGAALAQAGQNVVLVDFDVGRRNDSHESVVDGALELAAVDQQLDRIVEDMRRRLSLMRLVLVATLAHDVPEQDASLGRVDQIVGVG